MYYPTWNTSGSATITTGSWGGSAGATGRLVFDDVRLAPPPTPKTEVDRLLADVEAVCALAR